MTRRVCNGVRQFQEEYPVAGRQERAAKLLEKYPDHVPIVVGRHYADDPHCTRSKFLMRRTQVVGALLREMREKYLTYKENIDDVVGIPDVTPQGRTLVSTITDTLTASTVDMRAVGLFLFAGDRLLSMSQMIGTLYDQAKSDDGILYVTYCTENVFGSAHQ